MGNFEKLSVLVIVVIIVMILVVAIYTWTENPGDETTGGETHMSSTNPTDEPGGGTTLADIGKEGTDDFGGSSTEANTGTRSSDDALEELLGGAEGEEWDDGEAGAGDGTDGNLIPPVNGGEGDDGSATTDDGAASDGSTGTTEESTPQDGTDWQYTVKKGDSLSVIAMRELGTMRRVSDILGRNPGLDADKIREGQVLNMPPRKQDGSHAVVASTSGTDDAAVVRVRSERTGRQYEFPRFKGDFTSAGRDTGGPAPTVASGSISETPRPGAIYVTRLGDKLTSIAKRAYSNSEKWTSIYVRNSRQISDPTGSLPAGLRLFLPE